MQKKYTIDNILLSQVTYPERLITSYAKIGLSETEVMVILQIFRYLQRGIAFPTPDEIAEHLSINEQNCAMILQQLMQKNVLDIKELKNEKGQLGETYSFEPLWEQLYKESPDTQQKQKEEGTLFLQFEQEFGRPLSPFEIETINVWIDEDKLEPDLINAALREAVLMGKLNFKYIDRMLREWKRKGIKSVKQAKDASQSFRGTSTQKKYEAPNRDTSVYFNWLKGE